MTADTKDELGSERPGPAWFAAIKFPGLAGGRRIVELTAQRDRAERLLQEQATEIRVLRERVRKATETKSDSVS